VLLLLLLPLQLNHICNFSCCLTTAFFILQIERPSKDAHEAAIAAIDAEIEAIKSTRNGVQAKIDAALGNKRDLNKLKNRKVSCNCCLLLPVI
jgi:hypothetical protein